MSLDRQLLKLASSVGLLDSAVEEYNTLQGTDGLQDEAADEDLNQTLSKAYNLFRYTELLAVDEVAKNGPAAAAEVDEYRRLVQSYNEVLSQLPEQQTARFGVSTSKVDEAFEAVKRIVPVPVPAPPPPQAAPAPLTKKKSVRFNEDPVASVSDEPLKVYKDDEREQQLDQFRYHDDDNASTASDSLSNRQIFIANEQQTLSQDQTLESLSQSVSRQHAMSLQINNEVNDHMVLLDDLESGIEHTNSRVLRGRNNLTAFTQALSERKDWCTIVVLVGVLTFLLVVLK